jgi:hypothetical protein
VPFVPSNVNDQHMAVLLRFIRLRATKCKVYVACFLVTKGGHEVFAWVLKLLNTQVSERLGCLYSY